MVKIAARAYRHIRNTSVRVTGKVGLESITGRFSTQKKNLDF